MNKKNLKKLIKNLVDSEKIKDIEKQEWDSLAHLEIIFIIEKNSKKKISINKLEKLNRGIDIINILK